VTGELCVLYQLAGLYEASGTFDRGQDDSSRRRQNRMAALLALAASAQFVLVPFAAYSAAVIHH
jgi:hypothetical protein